MHLQNHPIRNDTIELCRLSASDVSETYVSWLNDPRVNRHLESRFRIHDLKSVQEYVKNLSEPTSDEILYGIYLRENHQHVGNIKIGPIDSTHHHATIGILIGDPSMWGKGLASNAIRLLVDHASRLEGITTFTAGCYSTNVGSYRAFLKAGWKHTGTLPSYRIDADGDIVDELLLTFTAPEFLNIPFDGGVTLIGSGAILESTACYLRELSIPCLVVSSQRHSSDEFATCIKSLDASFYVTPDPNVDPFFYERTSDYRRLCICFGPAWIFSSDVISHFSGRIFNYNGIPIPAYLGGAHFTWQILNHSLAGGCFVQRITENVDRGPIYAFRRYQIDDAPSLTPSDYDHINQSHGTILLKSFIDDCVLAGFVQAVPASEQPNWNQLFYFPRLLTSHNSWINWSWSGEQIHRFCCAFAAPYSGAQAFLNGIQVSISSAAYTSEPSIHPFCAGVITRVDHENSSCIVCVTGGFLYVKSIFDSRTSKPIVPRLGSRLHTPHAFLDKAMLPIRYDGNGPILSQPTLGNQSISA